MSVDPPELTQLNARIRQLRSLYEQYFQGIERIEPLKQREELKKLIARLAELRRHNTAFKSRLNSARQTLLTYEQYWDRVARQIEEGTYKRDKVRAARRMKARRSDELNGEVQPLHPPPNKNDELKELHRSYLRARTQVGDSRPVPMENFAKSIEKQRSAIKQRFGCQSVEFKVAVKDGRAIVRAIPK